MEDLTDLKKQLEFFKTADRMKMTYRRAWLSDQSRTENDAEHSWHVSILAMLFSNIMARRGLDQLKVLRMLLIHDIVEIEAGDTYAFDEEGIKSKKDRELRAADHLFGILPKEQGAEWKALWLDFDEGGSPEARFASALDKVHPFIQNYFACGKAWQINRPDPEKVLKRLAPLREEFPELYEEVEKIFQKSLHEGLLQYHCKGTVLP